MPTLSAAKRAAETVTDPELPMLTLKDLGVLRAVSIEGERVVVTITPTYTGCPAMDTMRDDLVCVLQEAGFSHVEVHTVLSPAWTTDWISDTGREKLAQAGIAPPGAAGRRSAGPIPLTLSPRPPAVTCPNCGATTTDEVSRFSATACKALRRCRSCDEPFEHFKEI